MSKVILALAESALAQPPEKSIGKRQTSYSKNQDLPQIHPSAPGGGFATRLAVFIRLRIAFPPTVSSWHDLMTATRSRPCDSVKFLQ